MLAEQTRLTVPDLKEKADRVGIDREKFDECLDTGRYGQQVQRDMEEGRRAGVTGTPSLFINGNELRGGAVTYETLVSAIKNELARSAQMK